MNSRDKKLLALFAKLEEHQQATLMDFAGFLASRPPAGDNSVLKPRPMSRPENETVVQAIRRLTRTFPMLERHKLMNDTSRCLAEYALRGRPAAEVIIELEMVFAQHYRSAKDEKRKMKAKG
jgi:hypothetical protein